MWIEKPSWLEEWLAGLNWYAGSWLDVTILGARLRLPPFDFTPGDWIESALDTVIDFANSALEWLADALQDLDTWASAKFKDVEDQVDESASRLEDEIGEVDKDLKSEIKGSVKELDRSLTKQLNRLKGDTEAELEETKSAFELWIDKINSRISAIDTFLSVFLEEVSEFFSSPVKWFADKLNDLWDADIFSD